MKDLFSYIPATLYKIKHYVKICKFKKEFPRILDLPKDVSGVIFEYCYNLEHYDESTLSLFCEFYGYELNLDEKWIKPNKYYDMKVPLCKDVKTYVDRRDKDLPICMYGDVLPQCCNGKEVFIIQCSFPEMNMGYRIDGMIFPPSWCGYGNLYYQECKLTEEGMRELHLDTEAITVSKLEIRYGFERELKSRNYIQIPTRTRISVYESFIKKWHQEWGNLKEPDFYNKLAIEYNDLGIYGI